MSGEIRSECAEFYREAAQLLEVEGIPFLVGGAYALACYTGISRQTKDVDFFLRAGDVDRALVAFQNAGYDTEKTFPHWLAKVHAKDNLVDLIYAAGNGLCEVDDSWFTRAREDELLGRPVKIVAPEEMIWMKSFIQERERYDGADVAHLFLSCADLIDWQHLRNRFAEDWRVLYSQIVLFGYIFPSERGRIPLELIREFNARMQEEQLTSFPERICRGTLLSRAQYLPDVAERGYRDARLDPRSAMSREDVARWTAAMAEENVEAPSKSGE